MPLSTEGVAHQIASALRTYKIDKLGTVNDCKVVINHLIRCFSEPLTKEGLQKQYYSKKITRDTITIREHVLPVKEIMNYFLELDLKHTELDLAILIQEYLIASLIIVDITKEEDSLLNECGYQQKMPEKYYDNTNLLYKDIWARYKCANIYNNILMNEC